MQNNPIQWNHPYILEDQSTFIIENKLEIHISKKHSFYEVLYINTDPTFGKNKSQPFLISLSKPEISFNPIMPEAPYLFLPAESITITYPFENNFYIQIPVSVSIQCNGKNVIEIPISILPQAWDGDFYRGNMCLGFSKQLHTEPILSYYNATLAILIKNIDKWENNYLLDKVFIDTSVLNLYLKDGYLCSSSLELTIQNTMDKNPYINYFSPEGSCFLLTAARKVHSNKWYSISI